MRMQKIHITGGPASGKTTFSKHVAATLRLPLYELDGIALQLQAAGRPFAEMATEVQRIVSLDHWVTEGAYLGWAEPLLQQADLIVWLDTSWHVASCRIILRHVKAEIARNNRFPGWQRLYRFWRWSKRYYQSPDNLGLNEYGTPNTRQAAVALLATYKAKLVIYRSDEDIQALMLQRLKGEDT